MVTPTKRVRQASSIPTRKVFAGGLAGAITLIAVWVLNDFDLLPKGQDIPGEVASALTTIITFLLSYFTPPLERDQIV